MQLHFVDPNFPSTLPLFFSCSSLHLTLLCLHRCLVYHLPALSRSSISPPFWLYLPCAPSNSASHLAPSIPAAACHPSRFLPASCLIHLVFQLLPFMFCFFLPVSFYAVWISPWSMWVMRVMKREVRLRVCTCVFSCDGQREKRKWVARRHLFRL